MNLRSLRTRLMRIAANIAETRAAPSVLFRLPRSERGACVDYRMGRARVQFYDPVQESDRLGGPAPQDRAREGTPC